MRCIWYKKYQFYGTPFTFINSLYNYYQLFDVLFAVSCAESLYRVFHDFRA